MTAPTAFIKGFVDTPLDDCIRRDPKDFMRRRGPGRLRTSPGPYEPPEVAEIKVTTMGVTPEAVAERDLDELRDRKIN